MSFLPGKKSLFFCEGKDGCRCRRKGPPGISKECLFHIKVFLLHAAPEEPLRERFLPFLGALLLVNLFILFLAAAVLVFTIFGAALTEISSNTAAAAIAMPIVQSLTGAMGLSPLPYLLLMTAAINTAYILPVSIRAIPVSCGLDASVMARYGVLASALSILAITLLGHSSSVSGQALPRYDRRENSSFISFRKAWAAPERSPPFLHTMDGAVTAAGVRGRTQRSSIMPFPASPSKVII